MNLVITNSYIVDLAAIICSFFTTYEYINNIYYQIRGYYIY